MDDTRAVTQLKPMADLRIIHFVRNFYRLFVVPAVETVRCESVPIAILKMDTVKGHEDFGCKRRPPIKCL